LPRVDDQQVAVRWLQVARKDQQVDTAGDALYASASFHGQWEIYGPYEAPPLHRGDRATCLYPDTEVMITSWTDAPIPWPRCRTLGVGGGSGLLVAEELVSPAFLSSQC
jgi:hypothetical protein